MWGGDDLFSHSHIIKILKDTQKSKQNLNYFSNKSNYFFLLTHLNRSNAKNMINPFDTAFMTSIILIECINKYGNLFQYHLFYGFNLSIKESKKWGSFGLIHLRLTTLGAYPMQIPIPIERF